MIKKLSAIYRSCNRELKKEEFNKSRPDWFNKFLCFDSFYNSFGDKDDIDVHLVFDGKAEDELAQYITKRNLKSVTYLNNVGNQNSAVACYDILSKTETEYVAVFEDDYLWLDNSRDLLLEGLLRFGEAGIICLYQHPDRVFRTDDVTLGKEYIFAGKSCYWRTAESNTLTFALKKSIFNKHYEEFVNCHIQDRLLFINLLTKYNVRQFTPISETQGGTHVNRFFPALYIDWEKYNNSIRR